MKNIRIFAVSVAAVFVLIGCGGGGGGGSDVGSTGASPGVAPGSTPSSPTPGVVDESTAQESVVVDCPKLRESYVAGISKDIDCFVQFRNGIPKETNISGVGIVISGADSLLKYVGLQTAEGYSSESIGLFSKVDTNPVKLEVRDGGRVAFRKKTSELLRAGSYKGEFSVSFDYYDPNIIFSGFPIQGGLRGGFVTFASAKVKFDLNVTPAAEDPRRLVVSKSGVAFTSTPVATLLTQKIKVSENFNFSESLTWNAVSNQPWLKVTSSGNTTDKSEILLTAIPDSLPNNEVSYATVTVNSSQQGIASAQIKVGLWRQISGGVSQLTLAEPVYLVDAKGAILSGEKRRAVADPIRPYFYVTQRGNSIDVFNSYLPAKIKSIGVPGSVLDNVAVSSDGGKIYAIDVEGAFLVEIDSNSSTVLRKSVIAKNIIDNYLETRFDAFTGGRPSVNFRLVNIGGVDLISIGDYIISPDGVGSVIKAGGFGNSLSGIYSAFPTSMEKVALTRFEFDKMRGGRLFSIEAESKYISRGNSFGQRYLNDQAEILYTAANDGGSWFFELKSNPIKRLECAYDFKTVSTVDGRTICFFRDFDDNSSSVGKGFFVLYSKNGDLVAKYEVPDNLLSKSTFPYYRGYFSNYFLSSDGLRLLSLSVRYSSIQTGKFEYQTFVVPVATN